MVLDACSKLVSHLGSHERVGDVILLEVVVQGNQIETDLLRDDMHRSTASECRIHIHHTGIKTIAGIGSHLMLRLQVIEALIPVAEGHEVAMHQLTPLGNTCRTRGIEQDKETVGCYRLTEGKR